MIPKKSPYVQVVNVQYETKERKISVVLTIGSY